MNFFDISIFILLIIFSAFFSGTELALMNIAEYKLNYLFKSKKLGSKSLKKIKQNNDRLLITILIGNNLVNVYTAALATSIAISLAKNGGLGINQSSAIGISTGLVTFLLLLFGEIIPKSFATKNATKIALLVAPFYKILMIILYPIIIFIELIIKIFSGKKYIEHITGDEIESFIDMGRKLGSLEEDEHEQIKNLLEFGDILVEEIMVPRVKIESLSINSTVGEAIDYYLNHTHSRIPLYKKTIDNIDFFFTIRDIINKDKNTKLSELNLPSVLKVPLNQPIDILLKTFQIKRRHIAIVIDEYGGVAGLITLEDVLEEVFGDIRDETDIEVDDMEKISKNSYILESDILFEDILDEYNLCFEDIGLDDNEFDGETLSYVITHRLERFPKKDEIIIFNIYLEGHIIGNIEFKILDINNGKIGKVEVIRK